MSGINSRNSSGLRTLDDTLLNNALISGDLAGFDHTARLTGFDSVSAQDLSNSNGLLNVNDVKATEGTALEVSTAGGVAEISMRTDETLSVTADGKLHRNVAAKAPLTLDDTTGQGELGLSTDASLRLVDGKLGVVPVEPPPKDTYRFDAPLTEITNGLDHDVTLQLDEASLRVDGGKLSVIFPEAAELEPVLAPITRTAQGLALSYDPDSLAVNDVGELEVVLPPAVDPEPEAVNAPLVRTETGLGLATGKGLKVNADNELETDFETVIVGKGAVSTAKLGSVALEDALELGFESLSELVGDTDVDSTVLRLRADTDDFTQTGGKLAMKSKGNQQIPYYGVFHGLNTRSNFTFNDTLSTLSVPRVKLATTFSPASDEAVTQDYVQQYIQGGSAIDVGAQSGNRRLVSVRHDASLAIDSAQNLGVNPSAIVNGSSVKVDGNGKIASGLIFQGANGLQLRSGTNNDVQLALKTQGALQMVDTATIKDTLTASAGVKRVDNDLQLDLQAGDSTIQVTGNSIKGGYVGSNGVAVSGNQISGSYQAGQNISISNGTIACTFQPDEPEPPEPLVGGNGIAVAGNTISNTMTISGGSGVIVVGAPGGPYTISVPPSVESMDQDDPPEERDEGEVETQEVSTSSGPSTVSIAGPVASIISSLIPALTAAPAAGVAPLAAGAGGFPLLPALAGGLFGGWATLWGLAPERKRKQVRNPDGSLQVDAEGNPVFEVAPDGTNVYELDAQGNPVIDYKGAHVALAVKSGCGATLLHDRDTASPCYRGIKYEFPQQVMNLGMTREYDTEVIVPARNAAINSAVTSAVQPLERKLTFSSPHLTRTGDSVSLDTSKITSLGPQTALTISPPVSITSAPVYTHGTNGQFRYYVDPNSVLGEGIYTRHLDIVSAGTQDGVSGGGAIRFLTNSNTQASAIERMRIKRDGGVAMYGALSVAGAITSPSLGALSSKNSIDLAGTDIGTSILPAAKADPLLARVAYVDSSIAGRQPLHARLTDIAASAPTSGNLLLGNGTTWVSTPKGALATLNSIDYQSALLTNKPTLGSISAKNAIDLATDVGASVLPEARVDPLIARVSYVDSSITSRQPLNTRLTDIAALAPTTGNFLLGNGATWVSTPKGALATLNSLDYQSASLTNKPTLGSISAKNAIDLALDVGTSTLPEARVDALLARVSYVDSSIAGRQPLNTKLTSLASSSPTLNNLLIGDGTNWVGTTPAGGRQALGLGTLSTLNSIAYSSLTGSPTLGTLSAKNTVSLTTDVTGILPYANLDQGVALKTYVDSAVSGSAGVISKSLYVAGGLTVAGLGGQRYPPVGLNYSSSTTSTTNVTGQPYANQNGTYVASVSSVNFGYSGFTYVFGLGTYAGWRTNDVYNAATGLYSGTATTTVSGSLVTGEWVQLQAPNPYPLRRLVLTAQTNAHTVMPRSFVIAGSNDLTTWTIVASYTSIVSYTSGASTNFEVQSAVEYSTYRIIVREVGLLTSGGTGQSFVLIGQIAFFASVGEVSIGSTTEATGTNTGALTVAGGLGVSKSMWIGSGPAPTPGVFIRTHLDRGLRIVDDGTGVSLVGHDFGNSGGVYRRVAITGGSIILSVGGGGAQPALTVSPLVADGTQNVVTINGSLDSSSTISGALQVKGGAGIAGNVCIGGTYYTSLSGTGPTVVASLMTPSLAAGSFSTLQVGASTSTNQAARMYFNYTGSGSASNTLGLGLWNSPQGLSVDGTGKVKILSTEDVSSSVAGSGALVCAGGASVAKGLSVGGTLNVNSLSVQNITTSSISTTTSMVKYPTQPSQGSYQWENLYAVSSSSEFTTDSEGSEVGSTSGYTYHGYDAFNSSFWQTNVSQTTPITLDGTSQNLHWITLQFPTSQTLTDVYITGRVAGMPHTVKVIGSTNGSSYVTVKSFTALTWTTAAKQLSFRENQAAYQYWAICWLNSDQIGGTSVRLFDISWYEEVINTKIRGTLQVTKSTATNTPNWRMLYDCKVYTAGVRSVGISLPQTKGSSLFISGSTSCYTTTNWISFTVTCNGQVIQTAKQYVTAANRNSENHYTIPIHGFAKNVSEYPGVTITFADGTNVDYYDYLTLMYFEF